MARDRGASHGIHGRPSLAATSLGREAAERAQQIAASMIDTANEAVRRALDGAGSAAQQKSVSPR